MSWMIKIEDVSKMYRLGLVGSSTFQDDIKRSWYKLRGKEDPFLKVGEENKRDVIGGDYVWALNDINFEVEQGEVLGIIGKNGAGKSTLLKLLSKVTKPTTGKITTRGRIASLLEVGTGFHPELTGRENVFLNGAILGMKKNEIKSKFDEIVDFSGCERYIDSPVKRYSSGMHVRLAFAVAAHLDPEILVVDEVLAVGDFEFQKKAIGKMKNVSKNEGRTVLFVSHNIASVRSLCTKGLLMKNGTVDFLGSVDETINKYLQKNSLSNINTDIDLLTHPNRTLKTNLLTSLRLFTTDKAIYSDSNIEFIISYDFKSKIKTPQFCVLLYNSSDVLVFSFISNYQDNNLNTDLVGVGKITCNVDKLNVLSGNYYLTIKLWTPGELLDEIESVISFKVEKKKDMSSNELKYDNTLGISFINSYWHH